MPPRNILPYAAFYASVAGLSLGYLWVNRSTLVPKARQATQWLREVSADFAQIHVIEPVKNIYTELVYREHYTLGKAETIKRQLEHSQQQFQKVFALWQVRIFQSECLIRFLKFDLIRFNSSCL